MNPVTLSISHHARRLALLAAPAVLGWCVVMLLAAVASADLAAGGPPSDGPLLAPFRWVPLARDLA